VCENRKSQTYIENTVTRVQKTWRIITDFPAEIFLSNGAALDSNAFRAKPQ